MFPNISVAPRILQNVDDTNVTEGAKKNLTCQVFAVPAPVFQWTSVPYLSGAQTRMSSPPYYTTTQEVEGNVLANGTNIYTFTCSAGNNVSTKTSSGKVTVLSKV